MKVLVAYPTRPSFVARDIKILASQHQVTEHQFFSLRPGNLFMGIRRLTQSDLLFLWFASIRAIPLVLAAALLRKKIIVVVGGYEAANCPEIEYGNARSPLLRMLTSWILRRSTVVLAVSAASRDAILQNLSVRPDRVQLVYHGFEDIAISTMPKKRPIALTVGRIDASGWQRKGLRDFFTAAEQLPELEFVHVGSVEVDVETFLGRKLADNVRLAGVVPFERMGDYYTSAKIYIQPSYHESFGCALAEAMLFRCIPVVREAYALPEVVGNTGVCYSGRDGDTLVAALRKAELKSEADGDRARQRILTGFSYARRQGALLEIMSELDPH